MLRSIYLVIYIICMLKCLNGFYCRSRQFPSNCMNLATKTAAIRNTKHSQGKSNLPTSIEHKPINSKRLYFERRISESSKSEQALFNVILELRDKDRIDFLDLALQSALMLSRFKVEANPYILKSLNIILTWIKTHQVVINKEIIHQLTKNVFSNIRSKTILSDIINTLQMHNYAQDEDLQIPKLLYVLQQEVWSQPDVEYMKSYLDFILDNLVQYTSEDLNDILRVLGKVGLRSYSTKFFRKMTDTSISNSYTLDFYLSSFIIRVLDEHVGATMKDLQKFRLKNPEILLLGKSNVGKSSLVNTLLNRKNIAKVSPTPGCTQKFHLFSVEARGERKLCIDDSNVKESIGLTIVDAPGLGFAETVDKNRQQSWQSLIMRYLAKRDSCSLVLHLVDSRHQPSQTDYEIQQILEDALSERKGNSIRPFTVLRVFTKVDKVDENEEQLLDYSEQLDTSTSETSTTLRKTDYVKISSLEKRGFEQLWDSIFTTIQHTVHNNTQIIH